MDQMKGYRTFILGALVALFGFAQTFDWSTIIHDQHKVGLIVAAVGIAVATLRAFTNTDPGKSQ